MRHRAASRGGVVLIAALSAGGAGPLAAQNADAPRAPRIIGTTAPAPPAAELVAPPSPVPTPLFSVAVRPPNAARLAPLPAQRTDEPEEIIVIGRGWRLPDLGSEWRARQKEAASEGRFGATALPLYDPAEPPPHSEVFTNGEQRRHGYIELFRVRFGRRARD
jgi:hypothetical protein